MVVTGSRQRDRPILWHLSASNTTLQLSLQRDPALPQSPPRITAPSRRKQSSHNAKSERESSI